MKTAAFVPIRLNSQRVSGKNLRPLSGSPLMCHILRTLTEVEGIDEVYVYCSDPAVRPYLPDGVRFLRRSEELDRDTTLGREIYDSFTAEVEADLYVLAHATSPFIRAETVADALRKVFSGEYDSAFSAEKIQTFAWYEGRPLNYSPENIPRTQTIEPVYIETSAFFIFPRALWTGRHRRIGDRPYMAVVDRIEGLDIDYPEDFTMAKIIASGLRRGTDPRPAIEALREENLNLQQEKRLLLTRLGLPGDYLEEKPKCSRCNDTGFLGSEVCSCLRGYYAKEQNKELSGLLDLGSQCFENFNFDYYSSVPDEDLGVSPRTNMELSLIHI